MSIKRAMVAIGFLGILFVAMGCENPPQATTTTVDLSKQCPTKNVQPEQHATSVQNLGDGIRIKIITGHVTVWSSVANERQIQRELEPFVNSGRYEIVRVNINRSPRGCLTSAEVYYRVKK